MAMGPQAEQASGTRWRVRTPAGSVRLILAACGAGLAAVVFGIVMARAGGGGGFMAPTATVPGSPGDTTADLVLGQLNFTQGTPTWLTAWTVAESGRRRITAATSRSTRASAPIASGWRTPKTTASWDGPVSPPSPPMRRPISSSGRSDFISNACNGGVGVNAASLCAPAGVAVDSAGNLYVADMFNARVLEYSHPFSSGKSAGLAASVVFGQLGSFTESSATTAV